MRFGCLEQGFDQLIIFLGRDLLVVPERGLSKGFPQLALSASPQDQYRFRCPDGVVPRRVDHQEATLAQRVFFLTIDSPRQPEPIA